MLKDQEHSTAEEPVMASALTNPTYRAIYESLEEDLVVGEKIPDDLDLLFIRSKRGVTPASFTLRGIDRTQLGQVTAPGKSAHISFTDDTEVFCQTVMDQPPKPWYALVSVTSAELESAGFHTLYAPLPRAPLHVRVAHEAHLSNPDLPEVPEGARKALVDIFNPRLRAAQS